MDEISERESPLPPEILGLLVRLGEYGQARENKPESKLAFLPSDRCFVLLLLTQALEILKPPPKPEPTPWDIVEQRREREERHRDYWEGRREQGTRLPHDWHTDAKLDPDAEDSPFDWDPSDFPDITPKELDYLGMDVMDRALAGPDPIDKLIKAVRAYFEQNPY
jgi:hypothetical protein